MSFHIKDDFKVGAPVSQVPVGWFNSVAKFLNGLIGGFGIETKKSSSGMSTVSLRKQALQQEIDNALDSIKVSKDAGTPDDRTDSPAVLDTSGGTWEWKAGGLKGLEMDCYCKIAPQSAGSNYSVFQRCTLTFSKDGLLVSGKLLSDRIRIQAKNA